MVDSRQIQNLIRCEKLILFLLLGLTENRQLDNVALSDLHLSDTAPTLLKDQKINTLLLSELITHEQFRKLMLDLEIYVDVLADMQVKSFPVVLPIIFLLHLFEYEVVKIK